MLDLEMLSEIIYQINLKSAFGHLVARASVSGETPLTDLTTRSTEELFLDSDDETDSNQKPKKKNEIIH